MISHLFWPKDWTLVAPLDPLADTEATGCLQSRYMITVKGPGGKRADIYPFVVQKSITLYGEKTYYCNGKLNGRTCNLLDP